MFPDELKEVPPFLVWIRNAIAIAIKNGDKINKNMLHMSMPPKLQARPYRAMYAFGTHIRVSNVEKHLTTLDSGVAATFQHECISRPNDQRSIIAKLEYVGWVEEILELNYGVLKIVVLLCNWVKANYSGSSATMK